MEKRYRHFGGAAFKFGRYPTGYGKIYKSINVLWNNFGAPSPGLPVSQAVAAGDFLHGVSSSAGRGERLTGNIKRILYGRKP